MKKIVFLVVIPFIISSCSLIRKNSDNDQVTSEVSVSVNDGTSYEKAVVIDEKNEHRGTAAEYSWLKKNYPGYKILKQEVSYYDNNPYDVITIRTKERKAKQVYFNISSFFGDI